MSRPNHAALALAASALAVFVGGCGSGHASSPAAAGGGGQPSSWVASTPAATGSLATVKWALPYGEPTTLDWPRAAAWSENTVLSTMCESLRSITPDLGYGAGLAQSIQHPDPLTYVYRLRSGVRFSDGRPLTAGDAAFSLKRNLDPKVGSYFSTWFTNVDTITATDPLTVTVKLKQPDVLFNEWMATAAGTVAEKAYVQREGARYGTAKGGVMCTGPFKLQKWTPGKSISVVRNDDYWDAAHKARSAGIDFQFITNTSTLDAALKSGQIDGSYEAPLDAQTTSSGKLYLGKSNAFVGANFTSRPGPVQDVRIRKALSLAIDRPAIAKTIYKGSAAPVVSSFLPGTWSYAKPLFAAQTARLPNPNTSNVAAAKALVGQVGKVRPLEVVVSADDPAQVQLATYLQAQGKLIGIPMHIDERPAAQAVAISFDPKLSSRYDMIIGGGYIDVPDPLSWVWVTLVPGAIFNDTKYDNPLVTKLAKEARRTQDPVARARLIGQIGQQAYGKDYDWLMMVNLAERLYLKKGVTGVPASMTSYIYSPWARGLGRGH